MYSSDMKDSQWAKLEPLLQEAVGDRHAGETAQISIAAGDRRRSVRGEDGLSVAAVAGRFPTPADGLSAASGLALVWDLGAGDQVLAGTEP